MEQIPEAPRPEEAEPKSLEIIASGARLAIEYADSGVFEQGHMGKNYAARSGYYHGVLTSLVRELEDSIASQPAGGPVAHQFFCDGEWHNFYNEAHYYNTKKAGYPIRDLYTSPQPAVPEQAPLIQRHYSCGCVSCICDHDERCLGCGATSCGTDDCLWRNSVSVAPIPEVDALAQFIRKVDGNNDMGAGALAEHICNWIAEGQRNEERK